MSTNVFLSFKAYPRSIGNALYTNWSYDDNFLIMDASRTVIPQFIYIYVTDYSAVSIGNSISAPVVVPLRDNNGNLTTQFTIDNYTQDMSFVIENGTQYHLIAQMVYQDNSGNINSANSLQSIVMCSTIPEVPNFEVTPTTGAFLIKLLNMSYSVPTPVSAFDGFSVLKGIFVTYATDSQLYSKFIPNDASNTLYTQPQRIDVSLGLYEVSVSSYNFNTDTAPNGDFVKWGGRSATSQSLLVDVDDTPGPVNNLRVYETMADFSNNMTQASTYTFVSNTIKWNLPTTGASAETITGYNIYRNNDVIANIINTNPDFSTRTYVDSSSSLQVNTLYSYTVAALNNNGEGPRALPVPIRAVVFPTQSSLNVDPSGSQALAMKVTNVNNGFPLASYLFDFSYNGVVVQDTSSNPYLATALINNTTYNVQSNTTVPSVNVPGVLYTTSFWTPPVQAVPFNPVAPNPRDISANPLDLSGNPSGTVALAWINSDVSNVGFTGQLSYTLSYKLASAPDASYVIQNTANCLSNQLSAYIMPLGVLTDGQSYVFKVFNTLTGTGTNVGKIAVSGNLISSQVVPFLVPGPVRNLALTNPTTNDMSYSWLPPLSTGGLPLSLYTAQLRLLNDGHIVLVGDVLTSSTSGNLSTLFGVLQQGSQYQLIVQASVDGSFGTTSGPFTGPSQSANNFTVPQGLNSPIATNFSNGTLLNGIQVSWETNSQYLALDGSNATFNIYRNASPIVLAAVSGTSYLDTTPTVGSNNFYQVVPIVNNVPGQYVAGSVPTPSATVQRIQLPNQPTNLAVTSRTSTSVNFSWTASTGGSGNDASLNYLWTITDASGNIDASGVTIGTTASQTNLDPAGVYIISVRTGVVNPQNNQVYYNNTSVPHITVALYNSPPAAGFIQVYGSDTIASNGALLTNLSDAPTVVGLTFAFYKIQVSTDASFINNLITENSTRSEFYISGLTNGTKYFVRAYNLYTDVLSNVVSSPVSPTAEGIPTPSPAQPTGVLANTETPQAITVYWSFPSPSTIQPNVYAVNVGTDPSNIIPTTVTFQPLSDFSSNTTQFYKTITGLNFGQTYYVNVIAGIQSPNSIAVSEPSQTVTAVPYTKPSEPRDFNNIPGDTTIISNWNPPLNSGGAGTGLNGPLFYALQLSQDPSFNTGVTYVSEVSATNYTFSNLLTNTTYNVRVRGYFAVQGNPNNLSYGDYATQLNVTTQTPPIDPTISNVTADNTLGLGGSQQGRTVLVSYTTDPTKAASITLKRRILDPTGITQLDNYRVIETKNVAANNSGIGQFVDTSSNSGASNFLNGNMMQYILDVSYIIVGGSVYSASTQPSVMAAPYAKPIPTDSSGNPIDLSNCIIPINQDASGGYTSFILRINKNGTPGLNSLVAVGLSNGGEQAYVISLSNPVIPYSNDQVDGQIAANQYANYIMDYSASASLPAGTNVISTLVIESNQGGSLLIAKPIPGPFGSPN